jgi:hypothetical protein
MKKVLNILMITLCVLPALSLSYAQEAYMEKPPVEGTYLDYQESPAQNNTSGQAAAVYNGAAGERFFHSGDREKKDPVSRRTDTDTSYGSHIDIYNVPPSFVNKITYDFSGDGFRRTSGHSFLGGSPGITDIVQIGAAFLTNLAVHEFGHEVVANYVGAEGSRLNFFEKSGGDFFLGTSHVDKIDRRSNLSYTMGGEFFADLAFEHALKDYRTNPSTYNKSLLVTSGADFLWYCFYAYYISGDNPAYDPITISNETGLSRDTLFSVALAKTIINTYRIYSGNDVLVPYFKVDKYSTSLNFIIPLDIGS